MEDINNNDPIFSSTLKTKVLRSWTAGTRVIRVYAYDEDVGENARVTYSLDSASNEFAIDQDMGYITVTGDLNGLSDVIQFIDKKIVVSLNVLVFYKIM